MLIQSYELHVQINPIRDIQRLVDSTAETVIVEMPGTVAREKR